MDDSQDTLDLGPLPKCDENAELQEKSIEALNSLLLGQKDLVFRDERKDDYGVDGSLELKIHGERTNFRSQVQLKGTASVEYNQDGSVSHRVRSANLNYLLVAVTEIQVTHSVRLRDFKSWVNRTGGAPKDVALRDRIREILPPGNR